MLCAVGCGQAVKSDKEIAEIDNFVAGEESFSGHIIISHGDSKIFDQVYGEATPGRKMTSAERWRWASVTKQIVSVAILQTVEQDLLDLDTPLQSILPDTTISTADEVTVRHLLQHTAGLSNPDDLPVKDFRRNFEPRRDCAGPVKCLPGSQFEYNNCDYVLLGEILEAIDGTTWFESLRQRIFIPAAMTTMGYDENNAGETVAGFDRPGVLSPEVSLSIYEASWGLVGTAEDLLRFNRALLSGQLIQDATRELLWESDPSLGYAALGQWVFPASLGGCDSPVTLVER